MNFTKILSLIILSIFFVGCSQTTTTTTNNNSKKYNIRTVHDNSHEDKEINIEDLEFFDSMEKAVMFEIKERGPKDSNGIKEVIKMLEKDDDCLIFIIENYDDCDWVLPYKSKTKIIDRKKYYSQPIMMTGVPWKVTLECHDLVKKDAIRDGKDVFKEQVKDDFIFGGASNNFNIGNDVQYIRYGMTTDDKVKSMKIDGNPPTEIIPIKLDKDDVYFWYYTNLNVDTSNLEDIDITY